MASSTAQRNATLVSTCLAAGLLLAASPVTAARPFLYSNGKFTNLRVQGNNIENIDINDQGLIAGSYFTGQRYHSNGFIYQAGIFSSFSVKNARSTTVSDLNNFGTIVGNYNIGFNDSKGFRYSNGAFTDIAVPGARETVVTSINDFGLVGGYFYDQTGVHGFLNQGETYQVINAPGAMLTYLKDINSSGEATGYFFTPTVDAGFFIYSSGSVTILDVPGAIDGEGFGTAINDSGDVIGDYNDAIYRNGRSFLYSGGSFTALGNPANVTRAVDINNSGVIVGYRYWPHLSDGPEAFVYEAGSYQYFVDPAGYGMRFEAINSNGAVVGLYNAGVPDTETWLLFILGFGVIGLVARQKMPMMYSPAI